MSAVDPRVEAQIVYVSLTDYVQHKEPPGGPMADRFHARFDAHTTTVLRSP